MTIINLAIASRDMINFPFSMQQKSDVAGLVFQLIFLLLSLYSLQVAGMLHKIIFDIVDIERFKYAIVQ
jgi:hypothetical protein